MKRTVICAVLFLGSVAIAAPAHAASTGGHCPPPNSGYIVWDVSQQPYQADNLVDEKGNGNGTVCAKPVKSNDGSGLQLYNFIDDAGAAQG
jgi:hypothetical protein